MSRARVQPFVGIDVSKGGVDVAIRPTGESFYVGAEEKGALVKRLHRIRPKLVVMEATGGYEQPWVWMLQEAEIPVCVANPRYVRHFSRATGQLAKTDRLDAQAIAKYAEAIQPKPQAARPEAEVKRRSWVDRREQLIAMRIAERQRLKQVRQPEIRRSIEKLIEVLEAELEAVEREIRASLSGDPVAKRLLGEPGVGEVLASTLLAHCPELGMVSRQQIAALAGLAPYNWDSGSYQGQRHCWGGRSRLRRVLYMATLSAIQRQTVLKPFYERLIRANKPRMVAVVACMRKFLTLLNAKVRDDLRARQVGVEPWHIPSVQLHSVTRERRGAPTERSDANRATF